MSGRLSMKAVLTDIMLRRACISSLFLLSCLLYFKIILEKYIKIPTHPLGRGGVCLKHIKNENICNKTGGVCSKYIYLAD